MSRSYSNIAIDFADQLANLKRRGLVVSDDAGALMQLHSISYFRLDCYMRFFETAPKVVKAGTRLEDGFDSAHQNCAGVVHVRQ